MTASTFWYFLMFIQCKWWYHSQWYRSLIFVSIFEKLEEIRELNREKWWNEKNEIYMCGFKITLKGANQTSTTELFCEKPRTIFAKKFHSRCLTGLYTSVQQLEQNQAKCYFIYKTLCYNISINSNRLKSWPMIKCSGPEKILKVQ